MDSPGCRASFPVFIESVMRYAVPKTTLRRKTPLSFRVIRKQRRQARAFREEILRSGKAFRLRPLIFVAAALALGCVLGPHFAAPYHVSMRAAPWLDAIALATQLAAIVAFFLALKPPDDKRSRVLASIQRALPTSRRTTPLALLSVLVLATALGAAQRQMPPPHDLSRMARITPVGAKEPPRVTFVGEISAPPRQNEFNIEFPLRAHAARFAGRDTDASGLVWVVLPRAETQRNEDAPSPATSESSSEYSRGTRPDGFVAGDLVKIRAALYEIPRASNIGEVSRESFYIAQHCWCLARAESFASAQKLQAAQGFARVLNETRRNIAARYQKSLASTRANESATPTRPYPGATSVLLTSLIFGEGGLREPLPRLTRERFRAVGLSHLLVASGTQISLLAGAAILLARVLALRGVALIFFTALPLGFYSALAGGEASILRAAIAGFCVVAALSLGRAIDALSLWSLALAILLLLDPAQISNIGLQLSFAATWGLLALSPALRVLATRRVSQPVPKSGAQTPPEPSWLPAALALLLGVHMATLPVQLAHFGTISAIALPINAVALPLAACITLFGVLALLSPVFAAPAYGFTRALDVLCSLAASAPGAQLSDLSVSRTALFLAMLLPFALCGAAAVAVALHNTGGVWRDLKTIARHEAVRLARPLQRRLRFAPQFTWKFLAALAMLCALLLFLNARRAPLRVAFLDVGQGDSIVISTPSGKTILIDGGSGDTRRGDVARGVIVPYLQSVGATQLDALIMTHADADHCNALAGVMREVPTKLVIDGAAGTAASGDSSGEYWRLKRLWRAQNVKVQPARAGQTIDCGDGVRLRVLAPRGGMNGLSENDRSAVTRMEFGDVSMLFTGDMEFDGENALLQSGENVRATVLKVGHHGSRGASSEAFLKSVAPRVAVVSCGRFNRYGHPSQDALSRLEDSGAEIFRTDRDGEVDVSCDEKSCEVTTFR
jgi:competence protein ComEC